MHGNYVLTIGAKYPNVQVICKGDPDVYENLEHVGGDPIPPEPELHAAMHAMITNDKWLEIKAERDRRKAAGVKVGNHWFHSDDASRIQQIALTMLGPNIPTGLQWKTMTGEFTTMTQALAAQIFQTSIMSDQTIFAIAENHRQAMIAADHPESYDFSAGWPLTFEESPEYAGLTA